MHASTTAHGRTMTNTGIKKPYVGKKHIDTMRKVQEALHCANKLEYVLRKYQQFFEGNQHNPIIRRRWKGSVEFKLLRGYAYYSTALERIKLLNLSTAYDVAHLREFVQKCYSSRDAFVQEAFDKIKEVEDNPEKLAKVILALKVKY